MISSTAQIVFKNMERSSKLQPKLKEVGGIDIDWTVYSLCTNVPSKASTDDIIYSLETQQEVSVLFKDVMTHNLTRLLYTEKVPSSYWNKYTFYSQRALGPVRIWDNTMYECIIIQICDGAKIAVTNHYYLNANMPAEEIYHCAKKIIKDINQIKFAEEENAAKQLNKQQFDAKKARIDNTINLLKTKQR